MEKVNAKIKKWGNSLGIILPKKIVDSENLKENSEVNIFIQPNKLMTVHDLIEFSRMNELKKLKKPTDKIMKEIDKELWPEEL
jgi:antitoxin component of MazEF toxin-antitoxin module